MVDKKAGELVWQLVGGLVVQWAGARAVQKESPWAAKMVR